jgi:hypothetical protein
MPAVLPPLANNLPRASVAQEAEEVSSHHWQITFKVNVGESFIDFDMPKKAWADWQKFWFYMREETPTS